MERQGGCGCAAIRYSLINDPLFIQACHCSDCQKHSGGAFNINAWIIESDLQLLRGELQSHMHEAGGGRKNEIFSCPDCATQLYCRYHGSPEATLFVRTGCFDQPASFSPMAHIYTRSKLPWVSLPAGVPQFEEFYSLKQCWPEQSLRRLKALQA